MIFIILESCSFCLDYNNIDHRRYHRDGRIDKRNGNLNKDIYIISICKIASINRLREKVFFKVKESSNG
jgi:hypothetical protein